MQFHDGIMLVATFESQSCNYAMQCHLLIGFVKPIAMHPYITMTINFNERKQIAPLPYTHRQHDEYMAKSHVKELNNEHNRYITFLTKGTGA